MRSNRRRDNDEFKRFELYLRDKHGARFDLEPLQELMLNLMYNYTGESKSGITYEKGHALKGFLDAAKQHMSKFGINKVTKPQLWAALDELREANIVKLVRTEQRPYTINTGYKQINGTKQIDHYQFTQHGDRLIEVAIRQAKQSTQGNALF